METMSTSETGASQHPSSGGVAGYLEGRLNTSERAEFHSHLAACIRCRVEVAELTDLLGAHARRRRWTIAAPVAAAAAALLLIAGPLSRDVGEDASSVRYPETAQREAVSAITVVTPASDATVEQTELLFTWRSLGEGTLYRLTLTDQGGDPLWIGETYDTTSSVHARVVLERSAVYLWYVDALLLDGETATTGVQRFQTPP
jgi:anti-sigma factor ChrR (cupin superfamily)